jgi:tRNA wybutosine-synthesizing protein 1
MKDEIRKMLEKQQYRFAGSHSAVKICEWTKKSLTDKGFCYKQKFYGINSHLCCQMSPAIGYCHNRCIFCWRDLDQTVGNEMVSDIDDPEEIIDGCIEAQRKMLNGYGGNSKVNKKKFREAQEPMNFAISLSGEPTIYPRMDELIKGLHKRGKTTFLVTNGLLPERLKKLKPTQLYVSVDAPNEELFNKIDRSSVKEGWNTLNKTLKMLPEMDTRTCLRFTLIRDINMLEPESYAAIIKKSKPMFVEAKAYMFLGSSRQRLSIENMPRHPDVVEFSKLIAEESGYKIIDEKEDSRVVLLMKKDRKDRFIRL